MMAGTSSIWVTGFARYDDLLEGHYIIGFTQVLDVASQKFITRGSDKHNYFDNEKVSKFNWLSRENRSASLKARRANGVPVLRR